MDPLDKVYAMLERNPLLDCRKQKTQGQFQGFVTLLRADRSGILLWKRKAL